MTVNQRRKRARGETYAGRKKVLFNLVQSLHNLTRPLVFVVNGYADTSKPIRVSQGWE